MAYLSIAIFLFIVSNGLAQPQVLSQVVIEGSSEACPAVSEISRVRNTSKAAIQAILRDTVVPELNLRDSCPCGGPGDWTRMAYLNMTDPTQQCPSNWRLVSSPERSCGRRTTNRGACDSATFPSQGRSYSHVCGRVIAYQKGTSDAFDPSVRGGRGQIESGYIDGISLTHGNPGSRQHIWSFVGAVGERNTNFPYFICPCTSTDITWPYQVPSFIGNNYFCDTANRGPGWNVNTVYTNDPLWDGEGCGPNNACCEFNNPPWFCTTLPQPTTDDMEMRHCHDGDEADEDILISLVDIYVM